MNVSGQGKNCIFAILCFARPNPIGLSVVRLLTVTNNILEIAEADRLDATPLPDIKPYVPQFDIKQGVKDSWYPNTSKRSRYQAAIESHAKT